VTDALAGLDPEQNEAAQAVRGPVCILAGAGTGKTRAITHRIAFAVRSGAMPVSHVLAVTFTTRAAGEMRTRLRALGADGVQARTFHSAALRQLQYFAPRILGGAMPDIVDQPLRLVSNAAVRVGVRVHREDLRDLTSEIEWAKSTLVTPEDYPMRAKAAARELPQPADVVADIYEQYEQAKRRAALLDFADLLLVTAAGIESFPDVAAQVRARYRHFVVDEYQDVSPLQQRLLEAWVGDRDDLCVVGDPNQTIYSFAGASPEYLLAFPRRYRNATVVRLHRDYRSTPQVVGLANALIAPVSGSGVRLHGQRPAGPEPTFAEYPNEPAEAAAVAAECTRLVTSGTEPADIAVLFRVNAQSEVYENALAQAGVPYVLRGGERFFDRPEIRQARVLLRGAARSDAATEPLLDPVHEVLAATGWTPGSPPPGGAARERWESLASLLALAEELLATDPDAGLPAFVAELDQRAEAAHAPTVQGVTLASLHAAKGLEWDAVFLVGLTDTTMPIQHATTPEQIAEERRLLYVGMTRARERLALSWALARLPGQRRGRRASRFLDGLRPKADRPSKIRAEKANAADAELFGRLRAWRRRQAEAQGVPAYVVFSDATLVGIADAHPADRAALSRVSGVGPAKLDRYADSVLALLAGDEPEAIA
jgi:DNA helicase-2/ATP-dependent DNA helicase PcrA